MALTGLRNRLRQLQKAIDQRVLGWSWTWSIRGQVPPDPDREHRVEFVVTEQDPATGELREVVNP